MQRFLVLRNAYLWERWSHRMLAIAARAGRAGQWKRAGDQGSGLHAKNMRRKKRKGKMGLKSALIDVQLNFEHGIQFLINALDYLFIIDNIRQNKIIIMFQSCQKAVSIFCSSLDEQALMDGVSDVIVVRHKTMEYKSTHFFACFGPYSVAYRGEPVKVFINKSLITHVQFTIDKYGYLQPTKLSSQNLMKLHLQFGKNTVSYQVEELILNAEIYLYADNEKILVSDVDGTLTKDDLGGLYNNYVGKNYLHDGYYELVNRISDNGYRIVWMTMRSLPMYQFTKQYIMNQVGVEGPLLMEPQEFFHAMKKELLKKTDTVKANIMENIKQAFPSHLNPFIGGLGNRENDAIAYLSAGISIGQIYIIDTNSEVHKLENVTQNLSYKQLVKDIEIHFPLYRAHKVGYSIMEDE